MNFTTPVSLNARPPEPKHFRGEGAQFVLAAYRVCDPSVDARFFASLRMTMHGAA